MYETELDVETQNHVELPEDTKHLLSDATWFVAAIYEKMATQLHRTNHKTLARAIWSSMEEFYFSGCVMTPSGHMQHVPHEVDTQGLLRCRRVCLTGDEKKAEAREFFRQILDCRLEAAREWPEVAV